MKLHVYYERLFPGHSMSSDRVDAYIYTKQHDGSPNPKTAPALERLRAYSAAKEIEVIEKQEASMIISEAGLKRRQDIKQRIQHGQSRAEAMWKTLFNVP